MHSYQLSGTGAGSNWPNVCAPRGVRRSPASKLLPALGRGLMQLALFGALGWCQLAHAGVYASEDGNVRVKRQSVPVSVGRVARAHDFGPSGGIVDPGTGSPRLATILAANGSKHTLLSGAAISKSGIPDRVEWTPGGLIMANLAGEGQPGKPCRAQAATYAVEPDVPLVWNLRVQLGDNQGEHRWQLLRSGEDPVLLWQLKAPGIQPSLAMVVDTDDSDPSRLMVSFSEKTGTASRVRRVGAIRGLSAGVPVDVRIEAVLDERQTHDGGKGRWRVLVNGTVVVDRVGPTLSEYATRPHQWFFGIYRYLTVCPTAVPRYTRWETVQLERLD
jgi:hypothetical protein